MRVSGKCAVSCVDAQIQYNRSETISGADVRLQYSSTYCYCMVDLIVLRAVYIIVLYSDAIVLYIL